MTDDYTRGRADADADALAHIEAHARTTRARAKQCIFPEARLRCEQTADILDALAAEIRMGHHTGASRASDEITLVTNRG